MEFWSREGSAFDGTWKSKAAPRGSQAGAIALDPLWVAEGFAQPEGAAEAPQGGYFNLPNRTASKMRAFWYQPRTQEVPRSRARKCLVKLAGAGQVASSRATGIESDMPIYS